MWAIQNKFLQSYITKYLGKLVWHKKVQTYHLILFDVSLWYQYVSDLSFLTQPSLLDRIQVIGS